ncbi:hypothetical protein ACFL0M_07640 [Thermodesulfobacteriota bacterium]
MNPSDWRIYIGKIPYSQKENYWVSFESDPGLKKTNANIYGRCLPCIQNLYDQLRKGRTRIKLGNAYNCWKITAIVKGIDECLALLNEFEKNFPKGHVYGKFGSGHPGVETRVVVFHTESTSERDRIRNALEKCLPKINQAGDIQISRACSVLFDDILGNWQHWQPATPIKYPQKVNQQLEKIQKILYRSVM